MSWMQKLYETYESCEAMSGIYTEDSYAILLPISHTLKNAEIEIMIDMDGNYVQGNIIKKNDTQTILPCTDSSAGRTGSRPATHPLFDKLQYVAADYQTYGGTKAYMYIEYKRLLSAWCESQYSHPKVNAVLKYIEKGTVLADLINAKVLMTAEDGKLLPKMSKKFNEDAPINRQDEYFVRWIVQDENRVPVALWREQDIHKSWILFNTKILNANCKKAYCYVTGELLPIADHHGKGLRGNKDGAKLISSSDFSGFTYRGRFETASQACAISSEVSQKAHNALRWLIAKQGKVFKTKNEPGYTVVAWALTGANIPRPLSDTYNVVKYADPDNIESIQLETGQDVAYQLKKYMAGYNATFNDTDEVIVMAIDAATIGRMGIVYYRELLGSEYLERIEQWHTTCCWKHFIRGIKFTGAPSPRDIVEAAYGANTKDSLFQSTINRLLPCIIDGRKIPVDIVQSVVTRASKREGLNEYEWATAVSIGCALYRKYMIDYKGVELDMTLDDNCNSRDYLYGRLLAIADLAEQAALRKLNMKRDTNATRYMQTFVQRPFTTWPKIKNALNPYISRLGKNANYYKKLLDHVTAKFDPDDFKNDKPLKGEYLLGFHCQNEEHWRSKKEETTNKQIEKVEE